MKVGLANIGGEGVVMTSRVLITGGASGLGRAHAGRNAARGDKVLVTDLADHLPTTTGAADVGYLRLDVRNDADWERARSEVLDRWGGLDVLINNAGVAAGGRIDVIPVEDWQWIIDVNLLGVVRGCRTFVPVFKDQGAGRIVNVASVAGLVHPPNMSSYNATKAGVVALSETLLHELAPYGVDVSVVCPAFFRSSLDQSLRAADPALEEPARALISGARQSADTVAASTLAALDKGHYLILPHAEAVLARAAKRLAWPLYRRAMGYVGAKAAKLATSRDASPGR